MRTSDPFGVTTLGTLESCLVSKVTRPSSGLGQGLLHRPPLEEFIVPAEQLRPFCANIAEHVAELEPADGARHCDVSQADIATQQIAVVLQHIESLDAFELLAIGARQGSCRLVHAANG